MLNEESFGFNNKCQICTDFPKKTHKEKERQRERDEETEDKISFV
jgi:hypothetical protein